MTTIDLADYGDMHICCVEAAYAGFTSVGADPKHIAALIEHAASLTAERDAAIARAERAEAWIANNDHWQKRAEIHDADRLTWKARAEAAEALAASRLDVSPEDAGLAYEMLRVRGPGGQMANAHTIARDNVLAALRAHAAKVSR